MCNLGTQATRTNEVVVFHPLELQYSLVKFLIVRKEERENGAILGQSGADLPAQGIVKPWARDDQMICDRHGSAIPEACLQAPRCRWYHDVSSLAFSRLGWTKFDDSMIQYFQHTETPRKIKFFICELEVIRDFGLRRPCWWKSDLRNAWQ